ncbi:STAS domain-containing protein [Phytomonospora sp. NPDC050363]|uniref:STAS domain-containing protein n=1 Tax=Phytomonospora sp. NPDC050363 TaxID=3155642 RepID=UPI0033FCB059
MKHLEESPFDTPDGLDIAFHDRPDCRVITLRGEIDIAVEGAQSAQFLDLVKDPPGDIALIDMSGVGFCDSTGIGLLIRAAKGLWQRGGTLRIIAPQPQIAHLLTTNGLNTALPASPTVDEAVKAATGPAA